MDDRLEFGNDTLFLRNGDVVDGIPWYTEVPVVTSGPAMPGGKRPGFLRAIVEERIAMLRVSGSKSSAVVDASSGVNLEAAPPPGLGVFAGLATGAKRCLTSALERIIEPSGMTCARRLAGAQPPVPSTPSGSSRPDPRPGCRRVRLSLLLPVLALLLGALSPFAAAPASADVLVSNMGQTADPDAYSFSNDRRGFSQGFTTGGHASGYDLESIELFLRSASLTRAEVARVRVGLWGSDRDRPRYKIADLTVPSSLAQPGGATVFAAPANVRLSANTPYFVVIYSTGDAVESVALEKTDSREEDSGTAGGWSIGNSAVAHAYVAGRGSADIIHGAVVPESLRIRVNGSAAPPLAPTGLTVGSGDMKLDLAWTAPAGTLAGYDVHYTSSMSVANYATAGSDAATGWVEVDRGTESDPPAVMQAITGLTGGTDYRVRVRAVDAIGNSVWAFGTGTPNAAPAAPQNVQTTAGAAKLDLTWTAPADTVTGYDVHYTASATVAKEAEAGTDAATEWVDASHTGTTATHAVTGLTGGTDYRVRVRAVNANGNSPWAFGAGTPPGDNPSPPMNVRVTPIAGALVLTWQPPGTWGKPGASTRGYDVQAKLAGEPDTAFEQVGDPIPGFDRAFTPPKEIANPSSVYRPGDTQARVLRVRVYNYRFNFDTFMNETRNGPWVEVGPAAALAAATAAPGAVTGLKATPGNTKLDISWTAPSEAVSGYDVHVTRSTSVANDAAVGATGDRLVDVWLNWGGGYGDPALRPSHTILPLRNGIPHRVRVRASNSQGDGPWKVVSATPGGAVAQWARPAVTVTETDADREVILDFALSRPLVGHATFSVSQTGGDAVQGADWSIGPGGCATGFPGARNLSCTITVKGDDLGESDETIRLKLGVDSGNVAVGRRDTMTVTIENDDAPPAAPTGLTALVVGGDTLDLAWTAPSRPVTGYDVHYTSADTATAAPDADASGSDPSAAWVDAGHSGTLAWHSIAGLTKGATYRLRVRGVNPAGAGDWLHGTKTVPTTAPGKPTHLSVLSISNGLRLNWLAPSDKGGAASVTYRAHITFSQTVADDAPVGTDSRTGWARWRTGHQSFTATTLDYVGLGHNAAYRVRVQARNSVGASGWTVGGGTTSSAGPQLTGLSLAAGSTAVALTPTFGGNHLTYTATVPHDATQVTVTPTWSGTGDATVRSRGPDGTALTNRSITTGASATVDLASSGDTVVIVHYSDGSASTDYRIDVSRDPAPPASPAPPSVPRNVQVTPGDGKLTLTWDAPMSWGDWTPQRFEVQWKLSSGGDSDWRGLKNSGGWVVDGPTVTGFDFTGYLVEPTHTVANDNAYDLRIAAMTQQPGTAGSQPHRQPEHFLRSDFVTVSGTPAAQTVAPPTAPRNVAATAGDGKVTLAWQAPSSWGDWTANAFEIDWKRSTDADDAWWGVSKVSGGTLQAARIQSTETSFEFAGDQYYNAMAQTRTVANGTAYDLRIRAASESSETYQYSPWVAVHDIVPGPAAAPTGLRVTAGNGALNLSWRAPSGTVTGYDVHYTSSSAVSMNADASGLDPSGAWVDARHAGTSAWHSITGVPKGATYRLRVRAVNAEGASAWLHGTKAVPVTAPGAPTALEVVPGNGVLDVSWLAPADTGGLAVSYRLHFTSNASVAADAAATGNAATGWKASGTVSGTAHRITGVNGTAYRVRVQAYNSAGASAWVHGSGTPTAEPVPRLTGLSLALSDGTAVALTPSFSGTRLNYTAEVPHGTASVSVTPTWGTGVGKVHAGSGSPDGESIFTNLFENTVSSSGGSVSVNLASSGDTLVSASAEEDTQHSPAFTKYIITVSLGPAPPSVPQNVEVAPGDGKLTLTWDAPMSWGGWPAGGYFISWKLSSADGVYFAPVFVSDNPVGAAPTDTSFVFTGGQQDPFSAEYTVTNGTAYDLRIEAVSLRPGGTATVLALVHGDHLTSDRVEVSGTPGLGPDAVTDLTVTAGNGKLDVSWTAPAGAVTGYDVHYTSASADAVANDATAGSDPATAWVALDRGTEADPPAVTQEVTGLANGTPYRVRVRAANADGNGPWEFSTGTPVLGAVTALTVTAGDEKLDVSWTAPSGTVTGYAVHYTSAPATGTDAVANEAAAGTDASTGWKAVDRGTEADPPAVTQEVAGLTNGTAYRVRVRAVNADGNGAWEFSSGTPVAPTAPGAVTDLRVSARDSALTVHWTAPSETLTGYEVHYTSAPATGSNAVLNDAAAGTDVATAWVPSSRPATSTFAGHGIPDLDNGTAYRVRVRARNGSSPGPWEFATGTPSAAAAVAPTVPRNVAVTPSDGKLTMAWQAPSNWGSWPALGFDVEWKLSSAGDSNWAGVSTQGTGASVGASATSFEFTGSQTDAGGTTHTVENGTAYDLRIRAVTQKSGTDGDDPSHYKHSDWVTVSNKVPMAMPDRAPPTVSTTAQTLWSATLTVRDTLTSNGQVLIRGCQGSGNVIGCNTKLTDDDFAFDGTNHDVTKVTLDNGGTLAFRVNKSLAGKKGRLLLHVGGVAFYGRDATFESGTSPANAVLRWSNTGLTWSTGGTVALSLVELPTVKLSVTPNPVEEGTAVAVTVSLLRGSGASRATSHIPHGSVQVPVIVTPGTAEPRHDYGRNHPRADGSRRYIVSIQGAHQRSFGVFNFPTHRDGDTDDETFTVAVDTASLSPSLVAGSVSSVAVTIEDLDEPPDLQPAVKLSVWPKTAVAEGSPVGVTVVMSRSLKEDVTIPLTVTRGTSEEGDHGTLEGVLIRAGSCCQTGLLKTFVDADIDDETFTVALDEAKLPASVRLDPDGPSSVAMTIADNGIPGIVMDEEPIVATEGTHDHAVFTVRLGGAPRKTVTVDYATAEGDGRSVRHEGTVARRATAGADYTAASGTLTFAPGETAKTVSVPILDDAVDEGPEYFLLRVSNPRGAHLARERSAAVGLILNDDHLQAMWLARFGRTVASQITDAVSDRLGAGLTPGAHVTVAGQALDLSRTDDGDAQAEALADLAHAFGALAGDDPFARHGLSDPWNDPATTTTRTMTEREVLLGSSFHLAGTGAGSGPALAAWGRVAHGSFDGEHEDDEGTTRFDGEVLTGMLGADADFGRVLAGVAVSLSGGKGKFTAPEVDVGSSGGIESAMTTVSPYARLRLTERVSAWGLAGWGTGDMTIRFDEEDMDPIRTDLSMRLGAIGARGALLRQEGPSGMDLSLKADAFFVRVGSEKAANSAEQETDTSRVRLVLEGGRSFALSETATFRPTLELGVRHDGGDAETGTGIELGGGIAFSDAASGLSVDGRARALVTHADSDYEEWGASATVRLDPGARGRGLSFSLAPTIGSASGATGRLWGARDARGLAPGGAFEASRSLRAEAGYGMALFGDRFTGTPNAGFELGDDGARDMADRLAADLCRARRPRLRGQP